MQSPRGGTDTTLNPKGRLQEWCQGRGVELPKYESLRIGGDDHTPLFNAVVTLPNICGVKKNVHSGQGTSKKQAEQRAAEDTLRYIEESWTEPKNEVGHKHNTTPDPPQPSFHPKQTQTPAEQMLLVDVENCTGEVKKILQIMKDQPRLPAGRRVCFVSSKSCSMNDQIERSLPADPGRVCYEQCVTNSRLNNAADIAIILIAAKLHKKGV